MSNSKLYIQELCNKLEDLLFDSVVIIFGLANQEYFEALKKYLCIKNKVIIIEPNKESYNKYKRNTNIEIDNFNIIYFDENEVETLFIKTINYDNFNRLHVHCYGDYEEKYKKEYDKFIEILDNRYLHVCSIIDIANTLRKNFFENMITNLSHINDSSPLNTYIDTLKDKPAIIVSAGPSLDKNMEVMLKHKDRLDNFFIITGNRTLGTMINNNIKPNLIVSIDPLPEIYEMMKKNLEVDVPLAYYEYSNKDLVKNYKGEKIYISQLLSQTIEDMKNISGTYVGGSVAHTCIDIARQMGCNPIILVGQDCALTFNKQYANNSTWNLEKSLENENIIVVKDVFGNDIFSTNTLNFFKVKIQEYIKVINLVMSIEFINSSYGADIIGAQFKELEEVLTDKKYNEKVSKLSPDKSINIDERKVKRDIYNHITYYLRKCDECIKICNEMISRGGKDSFMQMSPDDINLKQIIYILQTVADFENNINSSYLGSYLAKFLFDVREGYFEVQAKDYEYLTSNFKYQTNVFLNYFKELKVMLKEVNDLYLNITQKNS